jgi:hypothetical protein
VKVLSGIFHSRVEYPELPPSKLKVIEEARAAESDEEIIKVKEKDHNKDSTGTEDEQLTEEKEKQTEGGRKAQP